MRAASSHAQAADTRLPGVPLVPPGIRCTKRGPNARRLKKFQKYFGTNRLALGPGCPHSRRVLEGKRTIERTIGSTPALRATSAAASNDSCGVAARMVVVLMSRGEPGFGASSAARSRWAITDRGSEIPYFASTARACANVDLSATVGPEASRRDRLRAHRRSRG